MRFILKKDLPLAKARKEVVLLKQPNTNYSKIFLEEKTQKYLISIADILDQDIPEWLESIEKKNHYDDLISSESSEHKRRNWFCRKDKFIPKEWEKYFCYDTQAWGIIIINKNTFCTYDILTINSRLAFKTRKDCEKAIKEYDLPTLFYTIR